MKVDAGGDGDGQKHSVAVDFLAGSLGAATSVYVGQPLDTLKVKMQTFPNLYPNLGICFRYNFSFRSLLADLILRRETLKKEGVVRGLYAGTLPSLAANVAENSVLFAGYGVCQRLVARLAGASDISALSVTQNGLAGFVAAFFSSLVLCPTELVKCRMQAMREASSATAKPAVSPFGLTASILRLEGVAGLFRGLKPTFAREMPGYFCFFFAYEFTREALTPAGKTKEDIGPAGTIVAGGVAGVTLWTVIFPFDVIKSRQQVNNTSEPIFRAASDIYRREGLTALYSGLTPTLLRTFPATGALFFAYEYSRRFMLDTFV